MRAIAFAVVIVAGIASLSGALAEVQKPADNLGQFLRWLYPPKPEPPVVVPPPAPPVAAAPAPAPKAVVPKAKRPKAKRPKAKPKSKRPPVGLAPPQSPPSQRRPTAAECARARTWIRRIGLEATILAGMAYPPGFTRDEVERGLRQCGLLR